MIIKNEIPILEYDDSSIEVIAPDHEWTADKLPEKCLFAFLGDVVHEYADSLADVHEYDARDFGSDSHEKALLLGLDILRNWK